MHTASALAHDRYEFVIVEIKIDCADTDRQNIVAVIYFFLCPSVVTAMFFLLLPAIDYQKLAEANPVRFKSRDTAWNRNHPGELPLTLRIQTEKRRNLFFSACMTDCSVLNPHGAVAQSGGTAAIVRNRDHRVLCIRVNAVQHFHHFAKSPVVLPDRWLIQNQDLGSCRDHRRD